MQKAKKLKTLKRLESKERRTVTQINHVISKQLVQLAVDYDCGIRLEDLSKIRKTSKQRKKNKSDAAQNRDFWCYYQLENFIFYKAQLAGIPVEKVPAAFTSNYPIQKIIYSVSRTHEVRLTPADCPLRTASKPKTLYLTNMITAI